ncbi:MAG: hypothetical protein Q8O38_16900 [Sulfurimicrobium sp.]|nr:hypothetical protein [Sulfurimicrobium sp.]
MNYPIFALELDGCWLKFHRQGTTPSGASYPLLSEIGTLRSTARAAHLEGIGAGEAPNISVTLNNPKRRASDLIGLPLRRRARIEDAGGVLFEGVVSNITYGNTLTLEISA